MTDVATTSPGRTDQTWFADQVSTLLPELVATALRLCRNRADGDDLVAETVAKAWEALPALRQRDSFRAWMHRILANTFVSQCRADHARGDVQSLDAAEAGFSLFEHLHQPILLWWGNPEQDFLNGLLRDDLVRAIDRLPDTFRTVVVLVDIQALPYRDVALALGIPVGTVRSRLARGRSLLQRALWDDARDAGLRSGPAPSPERKDHPDDHT